MASSEDKVCQNCQKQFTIDASDFDFYEKMQVPAPTWCPQCRMIRRFVWFNTRKLFRRAEDREGKEIFSMYHKDSPVKIYERDYWWSDDWDPMEYGKEYDFSRPFFEQFLELFRTVPVPSRSVKDMVNSDYVNNCAGAKNSYLCFAGPLVENSAYCVINNNVKEGFDLYESCHSQLCYDSYMVDEAFRVFFSVNCEDCSDIWFSRNMVGCSDCFGCINLRNKKYHIFNKEVSKEDYKKFMDEFKSGSFKTVAEMRKKAEDFWMRHPKRFALAINSVDSTGEHIERTKNAKECYSVHEAENVKFCQFIEDVSDSYDQTRVGFPSSQIYESVAVGFEADSVKFSVYALTSVNNLEYSFWSAGSSDLFGCTGLRKKKYCILNKQYSKEEYYALREKIIQHMNEMPYTDKVGRIYKYGEFFPQDFSPFAYNETMAQDFFPLTKEEVLAKGYEWRDEEDKDFKITKKANELPDEIKDVDESIVKEVIECSGCAKAYRIIPMELDFYKRIPLPLPRLCVECRFQRRFNFVNPPKFWERKCQCAGTNDDSGVYKNEVEHFHGQEHCPNEFKTAFASEKPDIVYCEECYKTETV
ncbi:MAG: hypothetical protein Q8P56_03895 [Candidatus Uhrbacteria bacterium]|nr:hypothetical protein [Candidatus Uhrbacteria bacterium]